MSQVILNGQIVSGTSATPVIGATITLSQVLETNPITALRRTTSAGSSTTDSSGRVQFSGLSAGTYDVRAAVSTNNYDLFNVIVKNVDPVVPGGSQEVREGRTFLMSEVSVGVSGLMFPNEDIPAFTELGNPLDPRPETEYSNGWETTTYNNTLGDDKTFTVEKYKELDDRYFLDNQATQFSQSFIFRIS